jgi:ADP-heptose:LPS heptosyltransferase
LQGNHKLLNSKLDIRGPESKILLIHLGGLGDTCLSESTFLSLSRHFKGKVNALGYERFLSLFGRYFEKIHRIESIKWLHLFSGNPTSIKYKQIIFIGKDRQGDLRERWQGLSKEELIFIEMFPEGDGSMAHGAWGMEKGGEQTSLPPRSYELPASMLHVEDYQLAQLEQYGIAAVKKEIEAKPSGRIILYPEQGFTKRKWPLENFIELYGALKRRDLDVVILQPLGLKLEPEGRIFFEDLAEVRNYFQDGGIFVSNDSGMAHLAGHCGLFTITIFAGIDPSVWHPRGRNISLECGESDLDVRSIEELILSFLFGIKEL